MKVHELIKLLQEQDQEATVLVQHAEYDELSTKFTVFGFPAEQSVYINVGEFDDENN